MSPKKVMVFKTVTLTVISVILVACQTWATPRYFRPDYTARMPVGFLEGAIMPAALPGLVLGNDLPIYAPNNNGCPYKIGFIIGLNMCGTLFFGVAFWQPRRKRGTALQ